MQHQNATLGSGKGKISRTRGTALCKSEEQKRPLHELLQNQGLRHENESTNFGEKKNSTPQRLSQTLNRITIPRIKFITLHFSSKESGDPWVRHFGYLCASNFFILRCFNLEYSMLSSSPGAYHGAYHDSVRQETVELASGSSLAQMKIFASIPNAESRLSPDPRQLTIDFLPTQENLVKPSKTTHI